MAGCFAAIGLVCPDVAGTAIADRQVSLTERGHDLGDSVGVQRVIFGSRGKKADAGQPVGVRRNG